MKALFKFYSLVVIVIFTTSCTLEPIASIEDQQAALSGTYDTTSMNAGYEDDDYDEDEHEEGEEHEDEEHENESTGSISTSALNAIESYISSNFPGISIDEIELEGTVIEVELANGVELYFDLDGNFLGTDD
jgi:hypothetical protein